MKNYFVQMLVFRLQVYEKVFYMFTYELQQKEKVNKTLLKQIVSFNAYLMLKHPFPPL